MQYARINLLDKGHEKTYHDKVEKFKAENPEILNEGDGFKAGDIVCFISGYNDDIIYTTKVFGISEGKVYVYWDCYWFGVDIKRRDVKKVNN